MDIKYDIDKSLEYIEEKITEIEVKKNILQDIHTELTGRAFDCGFFSVSCIEKARSEIEKELRRFVSSDKKSLPGSEFPRVWTLEELAELVTAGRSNLDLFIEQHVEAVKCPDCGETLYRERRMVCDDCCGIYPAEKWASGEPCGCGGMDASYCGRAVNRHGQREFRQCVTTGCWWRGPNRELSVHRLTELAKEEAC